MGHPEARIARPSPYDAIAELYDPWSRSVTEDIPFYVAEARKAGGTVVELGVGTGRIAIPTAAAASRWATSSCSPAAARRTPRARRGS